MSPELEAFLKKNYKEMEGYKVELDADPTSTGLTQLNAKIATCRGWVNRVVSMYVESLRLKNKYTKIFKCSEAILEQKVNDALINDEEVKKGSTKEERQARARAKLKDDCEDMTRNADLLSDIKTYSEICKSVLDNLQDTKEDIKSQLNVIKSMIFVGDVELRGKEIAKSGYSGSGVIDI